MQNGRTDIYERIFVRPIRSRQPGLVHLFWEVDTAWRNQYLTQIYLDGVLYDVTIDTQVNEYFLFTDISRDIQVTLVGVLPQNRWVDHRGLFNGFQTWLNVDIIRDETLPVDSKVYMELNGEIDEGHRLWGESDARGGFGGWFGEGEFGNDEGLNSGWGQGEFGLDDSVWRWRRSDLDRGEYRLDIWITSNGLKVSGLNEPLSRSVEFIPRAAKDISLNQNVLSWSRRS